VGRRSTATWRTSSSIPRSLTRGATPCRAYPPNGYALYDVAGNVWEWVYDWYDARYYGTAGGRNPAGPPVGHLRLVRGGSWLVADVRMLTCSHRHKVPPDTYSYAVGFRVACSL
jgi:formylglycine-generating enzyme required for sulfatase activity